MPVEFSLVSFASGLLNTYGSFKAPAFTPVLLNLSFIAFALWLAPHLERPILVMAWAVFFGGIAVAGRICSKRKTGPSRGSSDWSARWGTPAAARYLTA